MRPGNFRCLGSRETKMPRTERASFFASEECAIEETMRGCSRGSYIPPLKENPGILRTDDSPFASLLHAIREFFGEDHI